MLTIALHLTHRCFVVATRCAYAAAAIAELGAVACAEWLARGEKA